MASLARPVVSRRAVGAWLVLVATLPGGLRSYYLSDRIGLIEWNPGETMGINYRTYHYAVERALAGKSFYDVPPPGTYEWAVYLYPPGTLPGFYPFALFDWTTGYAIMTLLSVLAAGGATWLLVSYVESLGPQLGWLDVGLVFVAFLLSTHAFGTIFYGNINLLLTLGIVVGFWALARDREHLAGVSFGLPALFKLFPVILGLWLVRNRRWRAVGAAVLTGLAGIAFGLLVYGVGTTRYYLTDVLTGRTDADQFVGGYPVDGITYVTIQQPLSHVVSAVWPSPPYLAIVTVSVLFCLGILAIFYRDLTTELDRQMAIFATLAVSVILIPSLRWYLLFLFLPLVTLLYLWQDGRARYVFMAGGVLFSFTVSTETVVEFLEAQPDIVETLAAPIGNTGVLPLWGLLLMLAACAWHKHYGERENSRSSTAW